VAIIGGGYAGLACALELARQGIGSVVLEAEAPGWGASTRNGGMVSSGASVGRRYAGKDDPARLASLRADAGEAFSLIERLIAEENIACDWTRNGGFVAAWCRAHYDALQAKAEALNGDPAAKPMSCRATASARRSARTTITAAWWCPTLPISIRRSISRGLLEACRQRGVAVCAEAPVRRLSRNGAGWTVETARGALSAGEIVVATNGYTGDATPDLKRRVIPVGSYIIATEPLARRTLPRG
jgi:glycine/D-amino acid oxidase-like deaminating enzyme